jgi:hypothetical protein
MPPHINFFTINQEISIPRPSLSIIALSVIVLVCSNEAVAVSAQSGDPCNQFRDRRTCELMSKHDTVKRTCRWTRVVYVERATKMSYEREACVSAR